MLIIKSGNLLDATESVIAHQVNCRGIMGSGVARAIRARYESVYGEYSLRCMGSSSPEELLGDAQFVRLPNGNTVINIFGQLNFGREVGTVYTSYSALKTAFDTIDSTLDTGVNIAIPYNLGCGLGGGDWGIVEELIMQCFQRRDVIAYVI